MRHPVKTPPFRGPDGDVLPGSIAEVSYRRLGGLDQWVMIRGESIANPSLILLHGGPGLSDTGFFRRFDAPLEKRFTVVYWDQRGAGRSFYPDIPRASMTVEQFISDLDELVDAVCKRLAKTKVAIFGHSWGSALGVPTLRASLRRSRRTWAAGRSATGRRVSRPSFSLTHTRRTEAFATHAGTAQAWRPRHPLPTPFSQLGVPTAHSPPFSLTHTSRIAAVDHSRRHDSSMEAQASPAHPLLATGSPTAQ
jgi:pimeloyl-ACP methyl ester carboxylesterase